MILPTEVRPLEYIDYSFTLCDTCIMQISSGVIWSPFTNQD